MASLVAWLTANAGLVGAGIVALLVAFGIINPDKVRALLAKLPWNKDEQPTPDAPPAMKSLDVVNDAKEFLQGLGFVEAIKDLKGDFDASKALFFVRVLSHEVDTIVLPTDKDTVATAFQEIALKIAAATKPPTPAT